MRVLPLCGLAVAAVLTGTAAAVPAGPVPAGPVPAAVPAGPVPAAPVPVDPVPDGLTTFPAAFTASLLTPDAPPPGANDWTCRPSARFPVPVVLIHGTWANAFNVWNELSPALKRDGLCVFAVNYGGPAGAVPKATGPIPDSAKELSVFVDRVLSATGASKVDLVGHSQGGGPMPRWYLKFLGGGAKVRKLIGLAPANHGTTLSGLSVLARLISSLGLPGLKIGDSGQQMVAGSEFNRALDEGGDTVAGVEYITIITRHDMVVTPYTNQFLSPGPGAKVTNIVLQDVCALDMTDHVGITYDPIAIQITRNHLNPADAHPPLCRPVLPLLSRLNLDVRLPPRTSPH
ncbi:Lipase (class 2) [Sinosporangium album]|uniref:Lipase (Class 2) n=1 Tax=Sinosporangium album TaxID=504805 RepID=A0A1G8HIS7_9ACTN|nr:alpha/beta fold hydrolase [Sinosporangium album]SDI06553.1 Lipase (class 2) [Sinosporangium album]